MQITGLFHVAIKTNDLDATVKFYTEVLGMNSPTAPTSAFRAPGCSSRAACRSSTSMPVARRWLTARCRTAPVRSIM